MKNRILVFALLVMRMSILSAQESSEPAYACLSRLIQRDSKSIFAFQIVKHHGGKSYFEYKVEAGKVHVIASSPVDLVRGAYDYLSLSCGSIISWSGNKITIPLELPEAVKSVNSPFKMRYYLNVVTHGYSAPYWDWNRWEKEIDWMAVHGINMPLLSGAHEAIMDRVFEKLGLSQEEREKYFCGPAYLPWNRMGNINGHDGPLSKVFLRKQIELNHKILKRLREMKMHPIIPVFAGFVPKSLNRIFPQENLRELKWGGFNENNHAFLLDPASKLFNTIGKLYIREWEKEFGKEEYYLADSFNEMTPPLSSDSTKALDELADYGRAVYNSIKEANPKATWVMQGWTFPYYRDANNELFWTAERLGALFSKVPDDKLLILDVTNEYSLLWWKRDPSWKKYSGFFGKKWIFAYIPVMGGHVPYNGRLDVYGSMSAEVLKYNKKQNLEGFGFAPEGIENNDIIYELLSDMAWQTKPMDLDGWIAHYCTNRYGAYPESMKTAYNYFRTSVYGNFTDDAIFQYQFGPLSNRRASVCKSEDFGKGVASFVASSAELKNSELYKQDLIEVVNQYLGLKVDELLWKFKNDSKESDYSLLNEALELMSVIDRLFESHATHKLSDWISSARNYGTSTEEKDKFEANAKRLITIWGGDTREITDYSARTWSGLIRDYYIPRWKLYYEAKKKNEPFDLFTWEYTYISTPGISKVEPFADPVEAASIFFSKYFKP